MAAKFETIDEYIKASAAPARPILREIRKIAKRVVPDAKETISYQMPAFRIDRTFFYFAAFKEHIGIFPPAKGSAALQKALERYRGPKGNLKFPLDEPMPYDLIEKVIKALAKQYARKS